MPMTGVMARDRRLEEIAEAFAEAVAAGDMAAAEGWLAVAAFVADRNGVREEPAART